MGVHRGFTNKGDSQIDLSLFFLSHLILYDELQLDMHLGTKNDSLKHGDNLWHQPICTSEEVTVKGNFSDGQLLFYYNWPNLYGVTLSCFVSSMCPPILLSWWNAGGFDIPITLGIPLPTRSPESRLHNDTIKIFTGIDPTISLCHDLCLWKSFESALFSQLQP